MVNEHSALLVPVMPNSPLKHADDHQVLGKVKLRRCVPLDFVENACFEPALAAYDADYTSNAAHSTTFVEHMNAMLDVLKRHLPERTRVVEVGCGKGEFVNLLEADGYFSVTGYDATYDGPSKRIHKRFLSPDDRIEADMVVIRHVLEHIQQPHKFLGMLREIFGDTRIFIEVPNFGWSLSNQTFFDVTYEHVNYFSPAALSALFSGHERDAGLCFSDQYQYIVADLKDLSRDFQENYDGNAWEELPFDVLFPELGTRIAEIDGVAASKRKVYLWGAATKGCMFLVHCARQNRLIDKLEFVVDINPRVQDKLLPGSLLPIKSKEELFSAATDNDLVIISNPNYRREIEAELRRAGLRLQTVCL